MKRVFFCVLLLVGSAFAQFTTVSGTITDPNGLAYANGTISAALVSSSTPKFTASNLPYFPPTQPVGLSSTGSFVMQLADNTLLTPGASTWSFTVSCAAGCVPVAGGKGPITFTVTGVTISGASQSITATLTAAAPALSNSAGAGLPAGSVVTTIPQTGLLAQYDFNEGSGTSLTDVSGNNNNGVLCAAGAAPTWLAVAAGGGLSFAAASSQCVTLPAALSTPLHTVIIAYQYMPAQNFSLATNGLVGLMSEQPIQVSNVGVIGFDNTSVNGTPAGLPALSMGDFGTNSSTNDGIAGAGTHVVALTGGGGPLTHTYHDGFENPFYRSQGNDNFNITTSVWQFGGSSWNTNWFSGQLYYALLYNTILTPVQIQQATLAIDQILTLRGVKIPVNGVTTNVDTYDVQGDSVTNGYAYSLLPNATATWWTANMYFSGGTVQVWDQSVAGVTCATNINPAAPYNDDSIYAFSGQRNAVLIQCGRNDFVLLSATQQQVVGAINNFCTGRHQKGYKCFVGTLLAYSSATQTNYNSFLRQSWRAMGIDELVDWAADANLGCQTCNTNGAPYWVDTLHPSIFGDDFLKWYTQVAWSQYYGNGDWSSANLYTTGAAAATATTAGTDAASPSGTTNSVATLTFASNPFTLGQRVSCTGITPSNYNTIYMPLTSTATQITSWFATGSVGNITVQGTCTTTEMQDVDLFIRLGGSGVSQSFTLQSACGKSLDIFIKNENTTSPWVLTPYTPPGGSAETIDNATTLTMPTATSGNLPVVQLRPIVSTPSTPVCGWKRMQ